MDFKKYNNMFINSPRSTLVKEKLVDDLLITIVALKKYFEDTGSYFFKQSTFFEFLNSSDLIIKNKRFAHIFKQSSRKRLVRHLIEQVSFVGLVIPSNNGYSILYDMIKNIMTRSDVQFYLREFLLKLNLISWSFLENKKNANNGEMDIFITKEIVRYLEKNKVATFFEIAIIFGFVGYENYKYEDFLIRKNVFEMLFKNKKTSTQEKSFFLNMGWKEEYKSSQSPAFKFKSFLVFMEVAGLLFLDRSSKSVSLVPGINLNDTHENNQKNKRDREIVKQRKQISDYKSELSKDSSFIKENGEGYVEIHHIIPLHLGGKDSLANTIALTSDEHKRAHFSSFDDKIKLNKEFRGIRKINNDNFINFIADKNLLNDAVFISTVSKIGLYD